MIMRKADIYFKGDIIQTVECLGISKDLSINANVLIKIKDGIGENAVKIVAVVPFDHLIVFREDLTVEIKGSDLLASINRTIDRNNLQ